MTNRSMPLLTCLVFALLTACSQSASDAPIEDPESSPEKDVGFEVLQIVSPNELIFQLPNPTENIRADNEDSFQGPLDESVLGSLQAGD